MLDHDWFDMIYFVWVLLFDPVQEKKAANKTHGALNFSTNTSLSH